MLLLLLPLPLLRLPLMLFNSFLCPLYTQPPVYSTTPTTTTTTTTPPSFIFNFPKIPRATKSMVKTALNKGKHKMIIIQQHSSWGDAGPVVAVGVGARDRDDTWRAPTARAPPLSTGILRQQSLSCDSSYQLLLCLFVYSRSTKRQ